VPDKTWPNSHSTRSWTLPQRHGERMDGEVPGMIARQVSLDRDRNTVIVSGRIGDH
jgi:hypothetical protein